MARTCAAMAPRSFRMAIEPEGLGLELGGKDACIN